MAWINTVAPEDKPAGLLGRIYDEASKRAGRVWNILRLQSLRPRQLQASMGLYLAAMIGETGISRAERELVATIVSAANGCFY
ncbi:MAG: hypothetical protein CMJ83_01000 [Planctomycetes bacterium]|nr:hypothetical protein [Planctomycetota bacterium]